MIIKIDGGETFEGTFEQFADCFFSNPTPSSIVKWATKMGSTVEFIPDSKPARICLFCVHFRYEQGEPYYSDLTPGLDAYMACKKKKWYWKNCDDTLDQFRKKMRTAETCPDFSPSEE